MGHFLKPRLTQVRSRDQVMWSAESASLSPKRQLSLKKGLDPLLQTAQETGFLKAPNVLDLEGLLISFTSAQTQECLNTSQVQSWGETWKNGCWRLWITEISLNLGKIRERNLPCQHVVFFAFVLFSFWGKKSSSLTWTEESDCNSLGWGLSWYIGGPGRYELYQRKWSMDKRN